MVLKIDLDTLDLEEGMYILAYDVPSENIKRLPESDKRMLASRRNYIRAQLFYVYGCPRLQNSLYRVSEQTVEAVKARVAEWAAWYDEKGFKAKLRLFPIGLNQEGYQTFLEMENDTILGWLTEIEELFKGYIDKKEIKQKALDENIKKIQVLESIIYEHFGPQSKDFDKKRFDTLHDELNFVRDALGQVQSYCKVTKYT